MFKLGVIGLVMAILVAVVLFPWAVIWALNTLFPALAIGYTFETWLAMLVIGMFIRSDVTVRSKK
jgi:hypothetical protein